MNVLDDVSFWSYQLPLVPGLISVGAVTVQAWDLVLHLSDEVQYLWIGRFTFVKALYFCSRYVMLAAQIVNHLLSYGVLVRLASAGNCSGIFVFKTLIAHVSLIMLEVILLMRVYALYGRSFKIKYFLYVVYGLGISSEIVGITLVIRSLHRHQGCSPPTLERISLLMFGLGAGQIQFVIFAMSLYKLTWDGRLSKTPLTSLLLREGVVVFLVVTAITAVLLTHELLQNLKLDFARAAFSWYLAVISMTASSLILNMRKLAVKNTLRHERPIGLENMEEEAGARTYDFEQSICLTSFYD